MSDAPDLSVIVYAREASPELRATLEALIAQEGIERTEVLLLDLTRDGLPPAWWRERPEVRVLRRAPDTMPALKGEAIGLARGAIVAILDPSACPSPGWLEAIRAYLRTHPAAVGVGGAVVYRGTGRGIDRAAWLYEYGAFCPPLADGETAGDLPGNSVAYRKDRLLELCGDLLPHGFWKPFFHARIRERGGQLHLSSTMEVGYHARHRLLAFCKRRFHYARAFGAMRFERSDARHRLLYRVFTPAVALLLTLRHLRMALGHSGRRRVLGLRAIPALKLVCLGWGLGEWVGVWRGAGRSGDEVY